MMHEPGLYVVATPIGNLEDITFRAVRILAAADVVAAEDTRRTRKLFQRYRVHTRLIALHEHNEERAAEGVLNRLRAGKTVALVSDAGTPLISDPGYRLVRAAAREGFAVIAVPGPSAVTAALSVCGLASDRFVFEGFGPSRPTARRKWLEGLAGEKRTMVFFESAHRIRQCLEDLRAVFGAGREAVICRELTKQFETVLRSDLEGLCERLDSDADQLKGEFVVLVEGSAGPGPAADGEQLAKALLEYLPASQAARVAARITGAARRDIYAAIRKKPSLSG